MSPLNRTGEAELIAAAERALRATIAAYSTTDPEAMMRAFTSDAVVEYALEEPGTYVLVEVAKLIAADLSTSLPPRSQVRISNLWTTPTNDRNSVLVHYTLNPGIPSSHSARESEHLALIEMRGDRIARMYDFNAAAAFSSTADRCGTRSAESPDILDADKS